MPLTVRPRPSQFQLVDQSISGEKDIVAATIDVVSGGLGGGLMAKILPTIGRVPSLILSRTLQNLGPNSIRMTGQEAGSDAIGAAAGVAVPGPSESSRCGCK